MLSVAPRVVNIDHHISNTKFGDVNLVEDTASSTCEIIAALAYGRGWPVPVAAASALLAGIYGDTGAFRYSTTSSDTFAVAQKLIASGAVPHVIADDLYGRKP